MKRILYAPIASLLALPIACAGEVTPDTRTLGQALEADPECDASTYEAEDMIHSTGGPTDGGWNIWSNGYISAPHDFEGGTTVLTVVVRGQAAAGAPPHMKVTIGGNEVYSTAVGSTSWTEYSFAVEAAAGEQDVQIHFTNDYYQNGQDRNLYVDKLIVGCGVGLCGNGIVDPNEECDDGNQDDGDGCSSECTLPPSDDWVDLTLLNGWKTEVNSRVPAVALINGVVTFRGGLDGTEASSGVPFCLTDERVGEPDYSQFRPADAGALTVRAAMAGEATGSLMLDFPFAGDEIPAEFWYCMHVQQHGDTELESRELTSLEGVSFDKSFEDSVWLDRAPGWVNSVPYPWRGSDSNAHAQGQGVFAKVVDGTVRFQGAIAGADGASSLILTLPLDAGMIPDEAVFLPVTLCPQSDGVAGRIVVQPSGEVSYEGDSAKAECAVSLDGAAYAISSSSSSAAISLSNSWSAYSDRSVEARLEDGIVRLEGAVKDGTSTTIGSLPSDMWPATTLYLVANAADFGDSATISIDSAGVIELVAPALADASSGLSLDGVSFSLDGDLLCGGECQNPTPIGKYEHSGSFETTGERWFVVSEDINGWQASQMSGRIITVNGVEVSPGEMPLPPAVGGTYTFYFSEGDHPWASWSFW